MRFKSGVARNYYSTKHKMCMLCYKPCFKYGFNCELCQVVKDYGINRRTALLGAEMKIIVNAELKPDPVHMQKTIKVPETEPVLSPTISLVVDTARELEEDSGGQDVQVAIEAKKEAEIEGTREGKTKALSEETWQRNQAASNQKKSLWRRLIAKLFAN
jgi:hypothetical protein